MKKKKNMQSWKAVIALLKHFHILETWQFLNGRNSHSECIVYRVENQCTSQQEIQNISSTLTFGARISNEELPSQTKSAGENSAIWSLAWHTAEEVKDFKLLAAGVYIVHTPSIFTGDLFNYLKLAQEACVQHTQWLFCGWVIAWSAPSPPCTSTIVLQGS